jgi:hypothetical protein
MGSWIQRGPLGTRNLSHKFDTGSLTPGYLKHSISFHSLTIPAPGFKKARLIVRLRMRAVGGRRGHESSHA